MLDDLLQKVQQFIGQAGNNIQQNVVRPVMNEVQQAPQQLSPLLQGLGQKIQAFGQNNFVQPAENAANGYRNFLINNPVSPFNKNAPLGQSLQQKSIQPLIDNFTGSGGKPAQVTYKNGKPQFDFSNVMNSPMAGFIMPGEGAADELSGKIAASKDAGEIAGLLKGKVADDIIPQLSQALKEIRL